MRHDKHNYLKSDKHAGPGKQRIIHHLLDLFHVESRGIYINIIFNFKRNGRDHLAVKHKLKLAYLVSLVLRSLNRTAVLKPVYLLGYSRLVKALFKKCGEIGSSTDSDLINILALVNLGLGNSFIRCNYICIYQFRICPVI